MDDLIHQVRVRATSPRPTASGWEPEAPRPPAGPAAIAKAEAAIGYALPPLLVRLYCEVGNGGFGPDYGLLGIDGGAGNEGGYDALAIYLAFRQPRNHDPHWSWPAHLLPLVHCGCAMYLCVDCSSPEGRIVWFEPNPHPDGQPWHDSLIPLTCDLTELLEAWLQGDSWINRFTPVEYRP